MSALVPGLPAVESIQSQLLDRVVTLLGGAPQNVFRCRMEDFALAQLPADNVLPNDEDAEPYTSGSTLCTFSFLVRHSASAGSQVDRVVDARYVRASQLLLADLTLGGLVLSLRYRKRRWERETGAQDVVTLVVTYEAQFMTDRADPSRPGY